MSFKKIRLIFSFVLFIGFDKIICGPESQPFNLLQLSSKDSETVEYEKLTSECVVDKTGEIGVHKLLEHCPWMQKEIENGYRAPVICDKEFCNDLVCCPIERNSSSKKNGNS